MVDYLLHYKSAIVTFQLFYMPYYFWDFMLKVVSLYFLFFLY